MRVFLVLLLVPLVIQHFMIRNLYINYEKRNKAALTFFFVLLTVLVMFRHESVGTDTDNYIYYFEKYRRWDWGMLRQSDLEIGFVFFVKFLSLFSQEPHFFLAVAAFAVSAMIFPTYKRLCKDASLTIVLFCTMSTFFMMFSGVRQMLAIGIGFIAYEYMRKKKVVPFILAVLLAMLFHTSGFMLFFMYPLYHARITKKWLYAVVPALVTIFVFNRVIFSALAALISRFTKYSGAISSTGAYTMLLVFAVFAVFAFLIPDESRMDKETIGLRNFLLLSLVLQMFAPLHTLAMRMNYYYIIFVPLLMPKIIACRSKRWNKVALLSRHILLIAFLGYFFLSAYQGGALDVFPYHFLWENV